MEMYFITTIGIKADGSTRERTIAMYKDFDKAKIRILENACDIFENGYYKWAVISKISEGIYPLDYLFDKNNAWFFYNKEKNEIKELKERPKGLIDYNLYVIG